MITDTKRVGADCPVCGEGCLTSHVRKNEVEYGGQHRALDLHYSECDSCGSDIATEAQTKKNKRSMVAFKKEVDGFLSGNEIRRFRERFGLKQDICAELFGGGAVAFSRYENDDIVQSQQMDKLIRLCHSDPQNITRLATQSGVLLQSETIKRIREESQRSIFETIESALSAFGKSRLPEESTVPANDEYYERFSSASTTVSRSHSWARDLGVVAA